MDELRIRLLIEKHRQQLTRKVEEAFSRAGTENRRKEGRGFYEMDEASIQTLRDDLTMDYQSLVKSHTAAIEQLLEDFNDDQMVFRLEAEALERERLAAIPTSPQRPQSRRKNLPAKRSRTRHRRNSPRPTHLLRMLTRNPI